MGRGGSRGKKVFKLTLIIQKQVMAQLSLGGGGEGGGGRQKTLR